MAFVRLNKRHVMLCYVILSFCPKIVLHSLHNFIKSYCTLSNSYCTLCAQKHTILCPALNMCPHRQISVDVNAQITDKQRWGDRNASDLCALDTGDVASITLLDLFATFDGRTRYSTATPGDIVWYWWLCIRLVHALQLNGYNQPVYSTCL